MEVSFALSELSFTFWEPRLTFFTLGIEFCIIGTEFCIMGAEFCILGIEISGSEFCMFQVCSRAEIWHGGGGILGQQDEINPEAPGLL